MLEFLQILRNLSTNKLNSNVQQNRLFGKACIYVESQCVAKDGNKMLEVGILELQLFLIYLVSYNIDTCVMKFEIQNIVRWKRHTCMKSINK